MLARPTSSPQMTRMFGRCPDGVGCGWVCACATCAGPPAAIAAAASDVPPRRMLRRSSTPWSGFVVLRSSLPLMSCSIYTLIRSLHSTGDGRPISFEKLSVGARSVLFHLRHHLIEVEARGLLAHRIFLEAFEPFGSERLHR